MINKERARRIAEARESYDERYLKQVTHAVDLIHEAYFAISDGKRTIIDFTADLGEERDAMNNTWVTFPDADVILYDNCIEQVLLVRGSGRTQPECEIMFGHCSHLSEDVARKDISTLRETPAKRKQVTTWILEHPEEFVDAMMSALEKKYSIREEGGRKSGRH